MNPSFLNYKMCLMKDANDFYTLMNELGDFQIFHKGYGEPLFNIEISIDENSIKYSVNSNTGTCRIDSLHRYAEIR